MRQQILRDKLRAKVIRHCRAEGCENESVTHHGPYKGLCDDCIAELGYHSALA